MTLQPQHTHMHTDTHTHTIGLNPPGVYSGGPGQGLIGVPAKITRRKYFLVFCDLFLGQNLDLISKGMFLNLNRFFEF